MQPCAVLGQWLLTRLLLNQNAFHAHVFLAPLFLLRPFPCSICSHALPQVSLPALSLMFLQTGGAMTKVYLEHDHEAISEIISFIYSDTCKLTSSSVWHLMEVSRSACPPESTCPRIQTVSEPHSPATTSLLSH